MLYYNVQAKIDEVFFLRCLENLREKCTPGSLPIMDSKARSWLIFHISGSILFLGYKRETKLSYI